MSLYSHLGVLSRRRALRSLHVSPSLCRHVSIDVNTRASYTEPTPSHLVRFALTGTTKPAHNDVSNPELDKHLSDIFLGDWPLASLPPPFWSSSGRQPRSPDEIGSFKALKHDVRNLRHLQVFIERSVNEAEGGLLLQTQSCALLAQALNRCQRKNSYGEILSALNAIITRLEKLGVPRTDNIYFLGMYYAALSLSVPALERFLDGYLSVSLWPMDILASKSLVNALLNALHYLRFREVSIDTNAILEIIEGGKQRRKKNLHDLLSWGDSAGPTTHRGHYLCLLARLKSEDLLSEVWRQTMWRLSPNTPPEMYQCMYTCIVTLMESGDVLRATDYLQEVSERSQGILPGISEFKDVNTLLESEVLGPLLPRMAGEKEYLKLLEAQLIQIENKMGLSWDSEGLYHTNISDPHSIISETPLFNIDGDSTGYESTARLIAEIKALGCSRSVTDLGKIAEMLDEHEGDVIPVSLPSTKGQDVEYAWFPRYSSFRRSGASSSAEREGTEPWTPSTLGLVRVSCNSSGSPLERSIHVMQLGRLARRARCPHDQDPTYDTLWEETEHMVTWDRVYGQFIAVYVGPSDGHIETRIESRAARARSGIEAITAFSLPGDTEPVSQGDLISFIGNASMHYYIEEDPSPDLIY
ncbi:hypothetical protein CBS115989_7818 [Aspergillus niger]|uniref:Fungal specific transcription factor domain family protein n=2 Tax=Aspergillus niger TaxID=5061 RepID=A0A3F3RRG2_ASPNG|nr:hypothetical protein ANI_1_2038184 [Aspergillus niger CBS 513.88]XP_025457255.1 uncharacterized protein BO96DRAFT_330440 [Aspergillus niger CBS 101883]KAI2815251.1 hypothetical protein CBS115989_7818 [Aspergillus niger]RDH15499.1 hypothetical protein M747DRAFT_318625 [Aspergillus niger ATCC 13496]KAI2825642.1 hypothetical protein CBS133816_8288 [Aspergillus niger]KAI2836099.1 hypothetical protein CBS11232_10290 [Aspergillus niger]KAI2843669.1 hypothetical protein CBS11350_5158 [Aspergillus|eukprot:XP_001402089.2 hypothetical protein ANI_1_2038184 [Aspergillus niger CBS 513.88]